MSKLLTVKEAAEKMGMSPETLKAWCNHVDPQTDRHAPKIEHVRLGGRGRPN